MKYGITQWSYPGNGIYAMKFVAQAGYDGMQIELGDYTNGYYLQYKQMQEIYLEEAERYSLEFPSIVFNDMMRIGFLGPKDHDEYKITIDAIDLCLSVADQMKIDTVMLPSFFATHIETDDDLARTAEVLKDTCVKAQKYGITVETETTLSAEKQIEMMNIVDMQNLTYFYDSQNLCWFDGYSQTEILTKMLPYMGKQLHLCDGFGFYKDNNPEGTCPNGGSILGTGESDFFGQMKILGENKFDGWLIVENAYWRPPLYYQGNPFDLAKKDLDIIKQVVSAW